MTADGHSREQPFARAATVDVAGVTLIAIAYPGTARAADEFDQVTNGTFDSTVAPWVAYGTAGGKLRVVVVEPGASGSPV